MTSFTENGAIAYSTTCSSNMDLFIKTVRGCSRDYIMETMKSAWNESPLILLKLMCMTRDPRDGKGERDVFYHMVEFLKNHFPRTYRLNALAFALKYGRLEDLFVFLGYSRDNDVFELELFADLLREDLGKRNPTLAVKWAPRERGHYGEYANKLANILFPDDRTALKRYRKEILTPLSEKVKTVEQYMCGGRWNEIEYSKVPASAMKLYGREKSRKWSKEEEEWHTGAFRRNDGERFATYLESVKKGETKINVSGIQPHELVGVAMSRNDGTVQLQWDTIVNRLRGIETLGTSMAVVDVSGSMRGQPMQVAIALGLLIAELAGGPFKDKMITFTDNPTFHNIVGGNLHEKVNNMSRARWGCSTNVEAVFDLMLNMAITFDIHPDRMVKTLFIFTDMQFNEASRAVRPLQGTLETSTCGANTETLFTTIRNKYAAANYPVPKLVFWNLRASVDAFPIKMDENGTAYLSGFSAELLKVFMRGEEFNPQTLLSMLLDKYEVLVDESEANYKFE